MVRRRRVADQPASVTDEARPWGADGASRPLPANSDRASRIRGRRTALISHGILFARVWPRAPGQVNEKVAGGALVRTRVVVITLIVVATVTVTVAAFRAFDGANAPQSTESSAPSAPDHAKTIAAAGDICPPSPSSCLPTAGLIERMEPDAVLALGDNQYEDGTLEEYEKSYDEAWGRFFDITFPVAGNHEWHTPGARGFLDYFGLTTHWYTFTVGRWRMYALDGSCDENGGCAEGDPQYEWLADELASRSDRCILAFWHEPRFSSGETHGSDDQLAPIWALLDDVDADLVLNGHEHNYERFAPQDANGNPDPDGIVQIVAGTGGTPRSYGFDGALDNSEARLGGIGVVKLSVWGSGWTAEFTRVDGRVVDGATGGC